MLIIIVKNGLIRVSSIWQIISPMYFNGSNIELINPAKLTIDKNGTVRILAKIE